MLARPILMPVLAGILTATTFASAVTAAPAANWSEGFAIFSTILCAPSAAIVATKEYIDDKTAIPVAQTYDENDEASGFFTQLPTETEIEETKEIDEQQTETEALPEPNAQSEEMPEGMVPIVSAHYEQGVGASYISTGVATIRNCTTLTSAEIQAEIVKGLPFEIELNSSEPQVLIMHTHATETYELELKSWTDPAFTARSTDTSINMVAVGEKIAQQLNAAGITTLQDTTLHDYPSYNGSYDKSNATVRAYLEKYPSIKVVLDVHRDAIQQQDQTRIKPIAEINGKTAAQVMIICGADNGGNLPNYKQNLQFAAQLQQQMESMYQGLTRPVLFDYRYYNQDLTTGSLLIEMGGHANTLDEALYSAELVGSVLAALFTKA